jgi:hypothetical protein
MRWNTTPEPRVGDARVVTRFLLLPKGINNEWRWLERATWTERRCLSRTTDWWRPVAWGEEAPAKPEFRRGGGKAGW